MAEEWKKEAKMRRFFSEKNCQVSEEDVKEMDFLRRK